MDFTMKQVKKQRKWEKSGVLRTAGSTDVAFQTAETEEVAFQTAMLQFKLQLTPVPCKAPVNYPCFGNDLHDLESVVMIWKPLGLYLKISTKQRENTVWKQDNQLTLCPWIGTLKTWQAECHLTGHAAPKQQQKHKMLCTGEKQSTSHANFIKANISTKKWFSAFLP